MKRVTDKIVHQDCNATDAQRFVCEQHNLLGRKMVNEQRTGDDIK